jgi:glycosyltransferase involved in cell wall biosynthesis
MKILIAGNLANMGYELAKSLRNYGVDAYLLMPKIPIISEDPKTIFPELEEEGYPEWIVFFNNHERKFDKNNWKIQVVKEMRKKYDGIIALTEFSIFAMFSGKPYAALSTGSDMRELPFEKSIKGLLYRLSYKKAKFIIWGEPDKKSLLKKLKIEKKAIFATSPRTISFSSKKNKNKEDSKFIIFHPTAQNWSYKNNKIFLEAFIEISKKYSNISLVLSDRGPNIKDAKKLLSSSTDTKNKYEFVPYLNLKELENHYNRSEIIVDQFGVGSFGMITVEAMFAGKPVMIKLNEELFNEHYNEKPLGLLNADTKEKIIYYLEKLIEDKNFVKQCSEENKKWIEKNWSNKKLTEHYISICQKLVN